jgi:ABC-type glycerol-3-phosphate transport system substrate-binding protein
MRGVHFILAAVVLVVVMVAWLEPRPDVADFDPRTGAAYKDTWSRRVHITYWEKWGSFEAEAAQKMVDAFNDSQDEVFCHYIRTSQVDRKAMLAIVGGQPPDVVGLWSDNVAPFAEAAALMPLDDLMAAAGLGDGHYIPKYLDMCRYEGRTFVLPTTPVSIALFYNLDHFRAKADRLRAAGLDPNRPPRTIDELDRYADALTEMAPDGTPGIMGFLPTEPGWYNVAWPYYFGGGLFDANGSPAPDTPANVRAFEWLKSYATRYGRDNLTRFREGFGNFDSPQNAFIDGKVSMVLQGVFFPQFIDRHRPALRYGVAALPCAAGVAGPRSLLNEDVIGIPRGCKHPEAAWKFVRWTQRRGLEIICRLQGKHLPLTSVPEGFRQGHPNRFVQVFEDLAKSPEAFIIPTSIIWQEYRDEYNRCFDHIWQWQPPADQLAGLTGAARDEKVRRLTHDEIVRTLGRLRAEIDQKLRRKLRRLDERKARAAR